MAVGAESIDHSVDPDELRPTAPAGEVVVPLRRIVDWLSRRLSEQEAGTQGLEAHQPDLFTPTPDLAKMVDQAAFLAGERQILDDLSDALPDLASGADSDPA